MLEFLSGLDSTMLIFVVVALIIFIFLIRKIFSIVFNLFIVAIISAAFPFVMNYFLNYNLPTDMNSLISFLTLGVTIYVLYVVATLVYKTLGIFEKVLGGMYKGRKREKEIEAVIDKKMEKEKPKKWLKEKKSNKKKIKPIDEKQFLVLKDKKREKKNKKS